MTARPDFASSAFRYAMRGWHVYRLAPGARVPLKGSHGFHDATRELDTVRIWWLDTPACNIGCATGRASGFWVLDVDRQHGGPLALAELTAMHNALPETLISRTPSGGFHHYWAWDDGSPEIRNSVSRVGPGLDVIGAGGGVPLPPSIRACRGVYSWVDAGVEIAAAPAWLVGLTRPPEPRPRASTRDQCPPSTATQGDLDRYCAAAIKDELRCLAGAPPGQRNHQLNRSAFAVAQFVGAGAIPEDGARGLLEDAAREIGLPAFEIRRTLDSAFLAGKATPRRLPE